MSKRFSVSREAEFFVIAHNSQDALRLVRHSISPAKQEDSWFNVGIEPSSKGGVGPVVYRVTVSLRGETYGNKCGPEEFDHVSKVLDDSVREAVHRLNRAEIPEIGLSPHGFSHLARACFSLNQKALENGESDAGTDEEVEDIVHKQGWNDQTLIELLIQYIGSVDGGFDGITRHLAKIASEENGEVGHV